MTAVSETIYVAELGPVHCIPGSELEARFIADEIFTHRSYFQHGITIPPNSTIVDVGANIGLFCLAATKLGAAHVLACEPAPNTFSILKENIHSYHLETQVITEQVAVLNVPEQQLVQMIIPEKYPGNARIVNTQFSAQEHTQDFNAELATVCALSLRQLLERHKLVHIDLLKIDTEGTELSVLQSLPWDGVHVEQVVMETDEVSLEKIGRLLENCGFTSAIAEKPTWAIKLDRPEWVIYARRS